MEGSSHANKIAVTELICCDKCDKAYHAKCLGVKVVDLPDPWHCQSCTKADDDGNGKKKKAATTKPIKSESGNEVADAGKKRKAARRQAKRTKRSAANKPIEAVSDVSPDDNEDNARGERKSATFPSKRMSRMESKRADTLSSMQTSGKKAKAATKSKADKASKQPKNDDGFGRKVKAATRPDVAEKVALATTSKKCATKQHIEKIDSSLDSESMVSSHNEADINLDYLLGDVSKSSLAGKALIFMQHTQNILCV